MQRPYQIAAYYFPSFHQDAHNDRWHGPGWTEWELLTQARARFPGHNQPKIPLWGPQDEADPVVMAQKIEAAAAHGVDAFIFDWYWYADGPFLHRALDKGFLGATNNQVIKFAVMWANHDWIDIFPYTLGTSMQVLAPANITPPVFAAATDVIVDRYFTHPSYWHVDGRPYFSFYELANFVRGMGGLPAAQVALDQFRAKARARGFSDIHLNAVIWGLQVLPGEQDNVTSDKLLAQLGFDSVTSYVWLHHTPLESFPTVPYATYARAAEAEWEKLARSHALPYYPNVTMGWDPSPRTLQTNPYVAHPYPFTPVLADNTPEAYAESLRVAKAYLDRLAPSARILTLNAWNEWTEGSYLEPDTIHGLAYLEAIREVFGVQRDDI